MKHFYLSVLLALLSFSVTAQWTYNTLSQNKTAMDVVSIGDKIIFHSGNYVKNNQNTDSDTTEIWNLTNGTKEIVVLPGRPVRGRGTAVVGSKVILAGGQTSITTSGQVDIYDTISKTWTRASLSLDRSGIAGVASNNKAYFAGGWNGATQKTVVNVDIYNNTTQGWSTSNLEYMNPTLSAAIQREAVAATTVGNKILFAGGHGQGFAVRNIVNMYDTQTEQWLPYSSPLAEPRTSSTAITYKDKVYIAGGVTYNETTNKRMASMIIDIYDNTTDNWSVMQIPRMMYTTNTFDPTRSYNQVVQAGCKLFLVPFPSSPTYGNNSKPEIPDTIAVYDLARNQWSYLSLPHPRTYVTAVANRNQVFFAGGITLCWGTPLNDVDILTLSPKLQISIDGTTATLYNFPATAPGTQAGKQIQLSNEGDYDLLFTDTKFVLSGTDKDDFSIDFSAIKDTLEPAQIVNLPVLFHPQTAGNKSASLTIYSNDPTKQAYTFQLNGSTPAPVTGIAEALPATVSLYPNPANDLLEIKIGESFNSAFLTLRDINGKTQQQLIIREAASNLNTASLADGLYLLEITMDGKTRTEKIRIAH